MNNNIFDILWIDDLRNPGDDTWKSWIINHLANYNGQTIKVTWAKSYDECTRFIVDGGLPSLICFDHDLGDSSPEEKTGYDCAKYIVGYCLTHNLEFPEYLIQSDNPVGRKNIESYIENFKNFEK